MDKAPQRKRFVYKAVISKNQKQKSCVEHGCNSYETNQQSDGFPDNIDDIVSQPSKKVKLDKNQDNILDDLIDDDFDFNEVANEIDNIEITASQQVSMQVKKPHNIILNNINKSTLSLKIPKNTNFVSKSSSLLSPLRPPLSKNIKPSIEDKLYFGANADLIGNASMSNSKDSISNLHKIINDYRDKATESEKNYLSKDGEIKILRETLRKQTEEDLKLKDKICQLQHQLKTQQSEKEENLVKEVEKLTTQLQFKSKEVEDILDKQKTAQQAKTAVKPLLSRNSFPVDGFSKSPPKISFSNKIKKTKISKLFHSISKNNLTIAQDYYLLKRFQCVSVGVQHLHCVHNNGNEVKLLQTDHLFTSHFNSILQLLQQRCSLFDQFLHQLCSCLSNLINILPHLKQVVVDASKVDEVPDYKTICCQCEEKYKIGVLSLLVLEEVSYCDEKFRKYLLQRCSVKNHKKNIDFKKERTKEIHDNICFYRKSETGVLVKSMDHMLIDYKEKKSTVDYAANEFWKLIHQINQINPVDQFVQNGVFKLLIALSVSVKTADANSLVQFINVYKFIPSYLSIDANGARIENVILLLTGCIVSCNVTTLLCSKSVKCPLLVIYNKLLHKNCTSYSRQLFSKVVSLLSTFIANQKKPAYNLLLESRCQCSTELIEFLITILFDEFKELERLNYTDNNYKQISSDRMTSFRQAITLLSTLCAHDKSLLDKKAAVESQFTYLLSGTIKLYRSNPSVNEAEVIALEDLIEFE